jgi:hypothetical protein
MCRVTVAVADVEVVLSSVYYSMTKLHLTSVGFRNGHEFEMYLCWTAIVFIEQGCSCIIRSRQRYLFCGHVQLHGRRKKA